MYPSQKRSFFSVVWVWLSLIKWSWKCLQSGKTFKFLPPAKQNHIYILSRVKCGDPFSGKLSIFFLRISLLWILKWVFSHEHWHFPAQMPSVQCRTLSSSRKPLSCGRVQCCCSKVVWYSLSVEDCFHVENLLNKCIKKASDSFPCSSFSTHTSPKSKLLMVKY